MSETFKCPSCSAPLEFQGKPLQKCLHCGSSVIVPSDVMRHSNVFGAAGALDFGDASALTGNAVKIAEIQRLIQSKQKIYAIKLFRETFGVGLKEAKDAVDAMESGEGIDISAMQIKAAKSTATAQNLAFGKKSGGGGGSILKTAIIIILLIAAIIGAVIYFANNS